MRNRALYVALRLASRLLPLLPVTLVYSIARIAGRCSYHLVGDARRAASKNLAVVLGQSADSPAVQRAVKSAFEHDAMNWVDTLRIPRLTAEEIVSMVDVDGWQLVESAIAEGKGLIMATLHLGNFDLVGQVLAARGYRLTVPVETMQPRELFDFLVAQRTSKGIRVVPVEHAARHMVRALKAHEVIGVACDRHIAGRTARVPMFGVPASLPLGPISLARRTGAPMLLGVGTRTGPGRFDGYIRPIPLSFGPDPDLDDQMNLRRLAAVMEEMIRLFPEQWLAFTPFWTDESAENGTDTMRHQSRAAV